MKKLFVIFLILIHIIFLLQNVIQAVSLGEEPYLYHKFVCDYNLQYWKQDHWSYAYVDYVVYKDKQGKEYPAYCLNETLHGVGTWEGSQAGYNVQISEIIQDDRIWRVIINGYPYKTPEQMGVENDQDAFVATKYAIYSIISGYSVREKYHGGTLRGEKIVNSMERLVDIGRNGTQKRAEEKLTIKELGEFEIDTTTPEYYAKEYKVSSTTSMTEYEIQKIEGLPEGSKIVDSNNQEKTIYVPTENFKILIPKEKLKESFNITVTIKGICKTYPIFYGKTTQEGYQNYAITADTYSDVITEQTMENHLYGYFTSKKVSSEDNLWTGHLEGQGVAGASYVIKNENNEVVKTVATDEEGRIATDLKLPVGKYTIQEIEGPEYFILDSKSYEFEISYKEHTELEIKEEVVKCGYLNFVKMSTDDNLWNQLPAGSLLEGATYELRNQEGKLLYELTTNENGSLNKPIKLKEGMYTLKEIKAPEHYILDETIYEFQVTENEQKINYTFYNKSEPKELKKLPKTGM